MISGTSFQVNISESLRGMIELTIHFVRSLPKTFSTFVNLVLKIGSGEYLLIHSDHLVTFPDPDDFADLSFSIES